MVARGVTEAAAAANLSRNVRQMFWLSVLGCVTCGLLGYWISWRFVIPLGPRGVQLRPGGTIVMVVVGWFFLSILVSRFLRGRRVLTAAVGD